MKYAIINGILLDGKKDMVPQYDRTLFIDGEKIEKISDGKDAIPEGYKVIDAQGMYILPGLINMHVHLAGNGRPQKKQRDNAKLVKLLFSNPVSAKAAEMMVAGYAKIELMSGVTTIRTVGGLKDLDTKLRDAIDSGKKDGPRILAANEGISVPGGHMAGSVAVAATSNEEAIGLVHKAAAQRVDLIKLMITGGVLDAKEKGTPGEMKMRPEMIKAVCDEAHRLGYKTAAHTESTEGVMAALRNGIDSIEHGAAPTEEMISLFKEKKAFLTTTLSPALPYALFPREISNASEVEQYNGKMVFDGIRDCAKECLKNGIPVALGNDVGCPWISQYDFWRELVYFRNFTNVSNAFALYTATLNNAILAGIGDITGSLEAGKCADLIMVENDPLEDLGTLRNVKTVIARGRIYDNPQVKRSQIIDEQLNKYLDVTE
ncbi:MAG: amidohydrolase family protein [Erysipelotrichaceae bacterium]|nr:amidohydrolase family protein [Erysipelotrichaceae bacterium]